MEILPKGQKISEANHKINLALLVLSGHYEMLQSSLPTVLISENKSSLSGCSQATFTRGNRWSKN